MYGTLEDLKKEISEEELIELTDDAGIGEIDQSVINEIGARSDGEINGYLAIRYKLPFETTPDLIKRIWVDIVLYYLKLRRAVVSDDVKERKSNANRQLKLVAEGKITLGVPAEEEPEEKDTTEVGVATRDKRFDDDAWEGYD